jgi:hypothetical protein
MTATATSLVPEIAAKFKVGAATCVIAAAAVLTPTAVAQADPAVPLASTGSLGGSAGSTAALITPECDPATSSECAAAAALPSLAGPGTIFQNPFWWFGPPNPNPPTQTPVFTFYPLNLLPAFIRPLFSWFADINYEACILGFTLRVGPYGAVSGSYSRGCA